MKAGKLLRCRLRRVHDREDGALSIETILILAAIAVPILIFILKVGWPKIQKYFNESTDTLIEQSYETQQGTSR
jgi:Flp pilus assembly pilin Flp